jgi:hypothetical protein
LVLKQENWKMFYKTFNWLNLQGSW